MQKQKKDVIKRVQRVLLNAIGSERIISEDYRLREDLGIDSLVLSAIIFNLEGEFKIRFQDCDLNPDGIKRMSDIVRLIEKYQ